MPDKNDDLQVVYGKRRSALYNLSSGNVYALNKSGAKIVESLLDGKKPNIIAGEIAGKERTDLDIINQQIKEFMVQLKQLGLFQKQPQQQYGVNCQGNLVQQNNNTFREVWLELTPKCNLKCLHCYASAGKDKKAGNVLDTDNWLSIIDQIGALGTSHLQLTGGEPFTIPDIWKLVERVNSHNIKLEIFSNLTLCTPYDLAKCKGMLSVATTILGPNAQIHDAITQVEGSFDKTCEAVRQLIKLGVPVRAAMIIMEQNIGYVAETLKLILSLGVTQYGTDYMRLVGRGRVNRKNSVSKSDIRPNATTDSWSFGYNKKYNPCWGHKIAIQPDGTVIPCIFSRNIQLGNVLKSPLSELILSDKTQDIWGMSLAKVEVCRDCEFRYACNDCRPMAMYEGNVITAKPPICSYDPCANEPDANQYPRG